MPIPLHQAQSLIQSFQVPRIINLFAQAHAKYVLHEVGEDPSNFPPFDPNLPDKVTVAAYALMAAGCSFIEADGRAEGAPTLERAASLLHYAHGPTARESRESCFHVLVASMGFYAAGHYSRSFVTIRQVEEQTLAAGIIAAYIRKDVAALIASINRVLLRETPTFEDEVDLDEWAITVAVARAGALALDLIFTGNSDALHEADRQLADAAIVASCGNHSAWWWIVRLFRLMLGDLGEASMWNVLPPFFVFSGHGDFRQYIRLCAYNRNPVIELWISQRAALPLALNKENPGGVINLRTSAGKTRVAELAILQALGGDQKRRVFYLAPFRSLAIEVEHTLSDTFSWLGYGVSHLYGGSRVSSIDTELAAESAITIATPEKARALLRASPELFQNVKLIIIDEGHLIGASERYVRNEVFVDHLRVLTQANDARLLLLSAVLPNPQELAEWITGDANSVAVSQWKPSAERFGLLRWNGRRVRIDWVGDVESFNPSFVRVGPLSFGRRRNLFPNNKNEAVAASAVRLSSVGPVMIFSGRAISVPKLAEATLLALGENPPDHPWPEHEWQMFEAICREELPPDALEVRAARAGVVCHCNRLTPQVRLATEHLMRVKPPRIIIATTTLGQGVNVGISTVIVATPYISQETISKRDFWNICGRAGRAFVDGEGKILYAIDETIPANPVLARRKRWQISKDEQLARDYFGTAGGDRVESGLLFVVSILRDLAAKAGVSFELLLELAAYNDFTQLGDEASNVEAVCDLVDDELLALHSDPAVNPENDEPDIWVERIFRNSLAVLQARAGGATAGPDDIVRFLRARTEAVLRRVPASARGAVISCGLPIGLAIRANDSQKTFAAIAASCADETASVDVLAGGLRGIEEWARANAGAITGEMPGEEQLDALRNGWIGGTPLQALSALDPNACDIARELYGYQLPWILHAAAQQLRSGDKPEEADALSRLALLVELGVPSEIAARIFLAGVRSRAAATELASVNADWDFSVSGITRKLRDPNFTGPIRSQVSSGTASWLDLMEADAARRQSKPIPSFPLFMLSGSEGASLLHARQIDDQVFLASTDGKTRIKVDSTEEFPFDRVANDPRLVFVKRNDTWAAIVLDPRARQEGLS